MSKRRNLSHSRKRNKDTELELLNTEEFEDECFFEGEIDFGEAIVIFNFSSNPDLSKTDTTTVLQTSK